MPVEMMERTSSTVVSSVVSGVVLANAASLMTNKPGNTNNKSGGGVKGKRLHDFSEKPCPMQSDEGTAGGGGLLSSSSSTLVNGSGASSAKRPKSNSMSSSGSSSSGEAVVESKSVGSKWVSGEFDLEERIAALPQLQDTHLINALNHKSSGLIAINGGTKDKSSTCHTHNHNHSSHQTTNSSATVSVASVAASLQSASVSASPPHGLVASMEVGPCDGLAALAEVALSQAKAITTSSSS